MSYSRPLRQYLRRLTAALGGFALILAVQLLCPFGTARAASSLFPTPPEVAEQVRFWERIFLQYPATTVVIHEATAPDRIIDVIDHQALAKPAASRRQRELLTTRYLARYTKALTRFATEHHQAVRYGAIEQRLYTIYHTDPKALDRLYSGQVRLRAQAGLADDFLVAARTAQAYLPYMEEIFAAASVPKRLTRLPFVESMFNIKARSKVGASGLWQFMPATARRFLYVNQLVDERNAPEKATKAAAQFLLSNYQELGTWPLAVTAYNHGKEGMARASRQLQTKDFAVILANYEAPSFGFASRNFYAEFLAASSAYETLSRKHQLAPGDAPAVASKVVLTKPLSMSQLLAATPLKKADLANLNPCLLPAAFSSLSHRQLPAAYELRVPVQQARAVRNALAVLESTRYAKK